MTNKGKPTKQVVDERKESEVADPKAARKIHRFDRSRSDEKGGKGPMPSRVSPRPTTASTQRAPRASSRAR
jgi:hypothetical protein